mgnify:CR=1 FL=1
MQACFEFSLHFYVIYRNKSTEKCVQIQNTSGRYPVLQQAYECICYWISTQIFLISATLPTTGNRDKVCYFY